MSASLTWSATPCALRQTSVNELPLPMSRTASTSSPAAPVNSEPQSRSSPTRPMDPADSSENGSISASTSPRATSFM